MTNGLPKPGEIWATRTDVWIPSIRARVAAGDSDLVLIAVDSSGSRDATELDVRVFPLSSRVDMASDEDVILREGETELSRPWMAETWNARPALVRNLHKRIAEVDDTVMQRVVAVHDSRYSGVLSEFAASTPIESEADPRFKFQETEISRVSYMSEPVFDLLSHADQAPKVVNAQPPKHTVHYVCEYGARAEHVVFMHRALKGDCFAAFRLLEEGTDVQARQWTALVHGFVLRQVQASYRAIMARAEIKQADMAPHYALQADFHGLDIMSRGAFSAQQVT